MKTAADYVEEVSRDLNDQQQGREYQRWSRALLVSYLNDALTEIIGYRPDAYAENTNISLVAGYQQQVVGRSVLKILSNADGSFVSEGELDLLTAWASAGMPAQPLRVDANGNPIYSVKSYAIDPKDPTQFYVSPPVPAGLTPVLKARCTLEPNYTLLTLGEQVPILPKYSNSVKDYMLYSAYSLDSESPEASKNAEACYRAFYQAMGVKYKMDSAYKSGNYNGTIGNGDPRSKQ